MEQRGSTERKTKGAQGQTREAIVQGEGATGPTKKAKRQKQRTNRQSKRAEGQNAPGEGRIVR